MPESGQLADGKSPSSPLSSQPTSPQTANGDAVEKQPRGTPAMLPRLRQAPCSSARLPQSLRGERPALSGPLPGRPHPLALPRRCRRKSSLVHSPGQRRLFAKPCSKDSWLLASRTPKPVQTKIPSQTSSPSWRRTSRCRRGWFSQAGTSMPRRSEFLISE